MTFCVALAFVIAFARTSSRESQLKMAARYEGEESDSGETGGSLAAWVSANIAERSPCLSVVLLGKTQHVLA